MVKHLLILSLTLTLVWGCDGKKSGTKTAETKSAEAKTVNEAQPQQPTGSTTAAKKPSETGSSNTKKAVGSVATTTGVNSAANPAKLASGPGTSPKGPAAKRPEVNVGPEALMDPSKAIATSPNTLVVKFETTKGDFNVQINRHWAPRGADRFYNLVKVGFFKDIALFRVIPGFMAQFGIHGDPKVASVWKNARIQDDKVNSNIASNTRGKLTFATAGPNTRSSQFFINFGDNARLDRMGFSPIGEIIENGMTTVDKIYGGYGEGAPRGKGPSQGRVQTEGNAYLKAEFPQMDYIKNVTIVSESDKVSGPTAPATSAGTDAKAAEPATPDNSALIKKATALKVRMCACTDRECTASVSKDAMALNGDFAKASPEEQKAMRKIGGEMSACIMKISQGAAAKAAPAADKAAPAADKKAAVPAK